MKKIILFLLLFSAFYAKAQEPGIEETPTYGNFLVINKDTFFVNCDFKIDTIYIWSNVPVEFDNNIISPTIYVEDIYSTGNMRLGATLFHEGDENTFITFADDNVRIQAGNVEMIRFIETGQDLITINHEGKDVDFLIKDDGDASYFFGDATDGSITVDGNIKIGTDGIYNVGSPTSKPDSIYANTVIAYTDVEIGTTSPDAKLEIEASASAPKIMLDFTGTRGDNWSIRSTEDGVYSGLRFRNEDETLDVLTLNQLGNVGIGIIDPLVPLHVTRTSDGTASIIENTNAGVTGIIQQINSTRAANQAFELFRASANGVEMFSIRGDGEGEFAAGLTLNDDLVVNGDITADNFTAISFGTDNQVTFMNSGGDGFDYDANFEWDGTRLFINRRSSNVFMGNDAGDINVSGSYNIGIGYQAIKDGSSLDRNVAIGYRAGYGFTTGDDNVFIGSNTGFTTNSTQNVFIGSGAAIGDGANFLTGNFNTALGSQAGASLRDDAISNTFLGYNTGATITTGDNNVFLGSLAGSQKTTESNLLMIENTNTNESLIYGEFDNRILKINGTQTQSTNTIADNDATPDVSANNVWTYAGSANSVTVTDLDNPDVGAIYTIIGNSDTYTITINDAGNFNLSANWVGGIDDVLTLFVQADNDYIETSRSDN